MQNSKEEQIKKLLKLVDPHQPSKLKSSILNELETLSGYDLVFVMSLMTSARYSGHLIVANEENLLSGITFIYGDIVKVDYHDQENLLGQLIVDNEILSKFEMQEVIVKSVGKRLGDYLIENGHLTNLQLRKILFKQTMQRLNKYISSLNVRLKFTFDGQSNDSILINKIDYQDILYKWIMVDFKDDWLEDYGEYYTQSVFHSQITAEGLQLVKDCPEAYDLAFKLSQLKKNDLTYNEIFKVAHKTRQKFFRTLHFMVLTGLLSLNRKEKDRLGIGDEKRIELLASMDEDLQSVQAHLLNQRYFEAFGLLNKYSSFMKSHPTVNFYFVWIKLIGAYEQNHLIDIKKISADFYEAGYDKVNLGEFYYVRALLNAVQGDAEGSAKDYALACEAHFEFSDYPLTKNKNAPGFIRRISNLFGAKR